MPTAVALATGCAARFGILIKNIEALELGAKKVRKSIHLYLCYFMATFQMTDFVFDKTGTLTTGYLRLSSISVTPQLLWPTELQSAINIASPLPVSRLTELIRASSVELTVPENDRLLWTPQCLLWFVACLQLKSAHPIARSIVRYCRQELGVGDLGTIEELPPFVEPLEYKDVPGEGIVGTIDITPVMNLLSVNRFESRIMKRQVAVGNHRFCVRILKECQSSQNQIRLLESATRNQSDGQTHVYVVFDGHFLGHLGLRDSPKPEARRVVEELKVRCCDSQFFSRLISHVVFLL